MIDIFLCRPPALEGRSPNATKILDLPEDVASHITLLNEGELILPFLDRDYTHV
jgi:hypothetical protein